MSKRNRSEGWRFAKTSGHEFEKEFSIRILEKTAEEHKSLREFVKKQGITGYPTSVNAEKGIEKVIDFTGKSKTQSKTDVAVRFSTGEILNISVKKPTVSHSQAHLTTLQRFLARVPDRSGREIPSEVIFIFRLFTGEIGSDNILDYASQSDLQSSILKKHNQKAEIHQNRLYITTIQKIYLNEWRIFQEWWSENIELITLLVFAEGYAKHESDFASVIYYGKVNKFFSLNEIARKSRGYVVLPRLKGYYAGSTLDMPWGYLQLHRPGKHYGPYKLQFHHSLFNITNLLR